MSGFRAQSARGRRQDSSPRAVIDIGSNTVRLVVYDGPRRAPVPVWNEKVAARLGQDLSATGSIPEHASAEALGALARYAMLVDGLGVQDVQTVATAAAREADNGPAFIEQVRALGLDPEVLPGEEEARVSAMGAIGAFPGAKGTVADIGGGSLELVRIADGECHGGHSLPLGTLRLPALRSDAGPDFHRRLRTMLKPASAELEQGQTLYMVGGTWRAFAAFAMRDEKNPLTDPHGYILDGARAEKLAKRVAGKSPDQLSDISGISSMRSEMLPDAAALLRAMLAELKPDRLVFSSWGLREGLLYDRLEPHRKVKDPLISGTASFSGGQEVVTDGSLLAAWSVDTARSPGKGHERLRFAAAMLAIALRRVEPNLRYRHAVEWALDKRWVGVTPRERAMLAAALLASCGKTSWPRELDALASEEDLREATAWGLGLRLGYRLSAASRVSLSESALDAKDGTLVMTLDPAKAALASDGIIADLTALAEWMELEPRLEIAPVTR
ncbi:Ppx/GppA family phosphatase [Alteriqipengyuania sp. WL0013]|uniref:Ppx/GppA family phosphatase n=1 Tax=Alteriqipengyuania sp. WL0013 TaxID=3110773 RepID=UPI002BE6942A|nr:Ppx/GppA family phosphatase [Alteriqipengyuania sp. WL0013]MEB3414551.1 Ppx/GppA family phosphatase [Alteriqipengyuania sp. WL0013]